MPPPTSAHSRRSCCCWRYLLHPSLLSSSKTVCLKKLLIFLGFGIFILTFHQIVLVARYHHHHDTNTTAVLLAIQSTWSLSSSASSLSSLSFPQLSNHDSVSNNNTIATVAVDAHDFKEGGGGVGQQQFHQHRQSFPLQPRNMVDNDDDDDIFQFDLKKSPPFAIFYNVYIPKANNSNMSADDEQEVNSITRRRARRIFQEQIKTIGKSYANSQTKDGKHQPVTVYYNTIGDDIALNASFVYNICTLAYNFTCRHLQHYNTAFEDVTLQKLYEFCHTAIVNNSNSNDDQKMNDLRVVYMHNKGSFNRARYQNDNRRIFTQTVTSQACLQQPQLDNDCNVCGHLFQPVWGPFFSGNFWVASCSYIRQLIPPKLINETMTEKLVPAIYEMQTQDKLLVSNLLPVVGPYALGTGRYSHEHWVAGHGTLRPCDVVVNINTEEEEERAVNNNNNNYNAMVVAGGTTRHTTTTQQRQMLAPRQHEYINSTKWYGFKPKWTTRVLKNKHLRLREYFLLPGYLFRLHVLYPKQGPPPSDSWVWRWFPDGKFWKDAVEEYGGILPAINAITARYSKNKTTTSRE